MRHYVYRCTTDKMSDALDRIAEAGDTVLWPVFCGGRDWVLICRKADERPADQLDRDPMMRLLVLLEQQERAFDRMVDAVTRGVSDGRLD